MVMNREVVGIDVGTTKTCTLVARTGSQGALELLGCGVVPSDGLEKGTIVDLHRAAEAVRASIREAEKSAGLSISSAIVGVTGGNVMAISRQGSVELRGANRAVRPADVATAVRRSAVGVVNGQQRILHVLPTSYALDGRWASYDPVGLRGEQLEVETQVVAGEVHSIQNLTASVERAGVRVKELVLEPIASGLAVLTPSEKTDGVLVADIGGGTTNLAMFLGNRVTFVSVLPIGGNQFTNDIAMGFTMPHVTAERIKVTQGRAVAGSYQEMLEVPGIGGSAPRTVPHWELVRILRERVEEVLHLVGARLKQAGWIHLPASGVVFTGGAAKMPGLDQIAAQILDAPVRIGRPNGIYNVPDELRDPAFATCMGLLLWRDNHVNGTYLPHDQDSLVEGVTQRVRSLLSGVMHGKN